jgi:hypothetical protein
VGEIFSSRTREVGVAVGAASQWLFNFMMSQITPHAISNIKWRIFPDVCDFQLCDSVLVGFSERGTSKKYFSSLFISFFLSLS